MKSNDWRNLRIVAREVTGWARELERMAPQAGQAQSKAPRKPTPAPAASLPPEYSYVTCKDCDTPAILLHVLARGSKLGTFAAYCPECMVITHIETIDQETKPNDRTLHP